MTGSVGPEHPDLFGLLNGDLTLDEAVAAGVHLESCDPCQRDLVRLAVGHAALRRTARTLGSSTVAAAAPDIQSTDTSLPDARPAPTPTPTPAPSPARALSGVHESSRRRAAILAAAAAVVGALVVGGAVALQQERSTPSATPPVPSPTSTPLVGSVPLSPVDAPTAAHGDVTMYRADASHTLMRVSTSGLPKVGEDEYYYAWLFDPTTQKMLPLGQVGTGDDNSFDVTDGTVAAYSAVDISLETDDGDPGHSATSVLRGTY